MISVIFCSRAKGNPDSDVRRLLDSAEAHVRPDERDKIEFLIKYDDDDDERPADSVLASYPFPVRTFVWSRGEGRHYLHHAQEYMFTERDPRSRFCLMTADDFFFHRTGFVSDILSIKDEFCIIGHSRPPIEEYAGLYEREEAIRKWNVSFGGLAPVVSAKLIEVCQNFGWQSNVDSWLMGLSIVLYDLYGITIWKAVEPYYNRGGGWGLGDTPTYNRMELTGMKGPYNKYWFELLRRQARNLYLNMEYGTAFEVHPLSPRKMWRKTRGASGRLWRKVRAQPLRRLPIRIARRILREMAGAA
jgi:hypothetical protein